MRIESGSKNNPRLEFSGVHHGDFDHICGGSNLFFYACVVARMVRLMDSKPMQRLGNSHQRPYLPYSKNRGELSHKHYLWGFRHQVSIVSATWRIEILS